MFSSTSIFYSVGVKVLIQIAEDTIVLLRKRAEKEENPLFSSLATLCFSKQFGVGRRLANDG